MQDSNLPALLQSRLNAPRIMEVSKVADYCKQKLADHDVHLTPVPLYWSTRQEGHQVGTASSDKCLQFAPGHPGVPEEVHHDVNAG